MHDRDSLRRFIFERFPVRGELVHMDTAWQAVLERHEYPPPVRDLLGEAMAATALLAATLKFEGTLTLQLHSEGPLRLLVVKCGEDLVLRGLARWEGEVATGGLETIAPEGRLAITIEQADENRRYQSIVPLDGPTLAACLQRYFRDSEQLPTRLWLTAGPSVCVGMLLQQMPEAPRQPAPADPEGWHRVQVLADTITEQELAGLPDVAILRRLFSEEDVRFFESRPVAFGCSCSAERVEGALRFLGGDELRDIVAEQGGVSVRCEFCNRLYELDPVDIEALLSGDKPAGGSSAVH